MFFLTAIIICNYVCLPSAKGRAIRKVMGGGGGRSTKKKNHVRENLVKKIHAQRVAQKKVLKYGKKYSCKGNVNKTIRAARKFPTPLPP